MGTRAIVSYACNHDKVLTDALGELHPRAIAQPRIVSLVPSITELVCDLGLAQYLVGRTGFCVHPREILRKVAKVGGTKDIKTEMIRALEPTHLIVNIDENRREAVDALRGFIPNVIVTHPCAPEDNVALYRLIGGIFGVEDAAEERVGQFMEALAEADAVRVRCAPEQVLYLIWREPWMTVSRQTYISAMLARVGWVSWPAESEHRYPAFSWDDAWLSSVDRVLLSSEPYSFRDKHRDEVAKLSGVPVELIDGEMASWYGTRAIAGLRYLAKLRLHLACGKAPC